MIHSTATSEPAIEPGTPLDVTVSSDADHPSLWQIDLRGELDVETAPRVRQQLAEVTRAGATAAVVDLRHVTFLDSSGLSALIEAGNALADQGGALYLEGATGAVKQVLEITALLERYRRSTD